MSVLYRMSALVDWFGECSRGEGLVWLIVAVVCSLAAAAGPMVQLFVSARSGRPH